MGKLTKQEKDAARQNDPDFDKRSEEEQTEEVISLEEMTALYFAMIDDPANADPRAKVVYDAARAAGTIDAEGNYVGPPSEEELEEEVESELSDGDL